MPISENDRLDLRQALADVLGSERLAEVAMEAMPPLDYDKLATKADLDTLGRELRAEMAQLRAELRGESADFRGQLSELRGELKSDLASNLRLMLVAQVTTMMMLGAWVTAVT
ncbi:MAG: hypothetical protein AAFO29_17270 [Actinomycetota bacterium]